MRRAALVLALLAAACTGDGETAPDVTPADRSGLPLQELPPQRLGAGQCALFLWTRTEPAQRVVMALNRPALARVQLAGRTVDLPRTAFEGDAAFGHYAEQRFAGDDLSLTVEVQIAVRSGMVGGAVVPAGTLAFAAGTGEITVIPVVGLIGCQI